MYNIEQLSDKRLLSCRIKDLNLDLQDPMLRSCIRQLRRELDSHDLKFDPDIYIGDDWFTPLGSNAISIPFFLTHSRLRDLEEAKRGVVEGGSRDWCMRLLRHEAGHCFDYVYNFSSRSSWQKMFGDRTIPYRVDRYKKVPNHPDYVVNLPDSYAQSHPDEDFAETFAVILDPKSNWKSQYRPAGKAIKKLQYVAKLMESCKKSSIPDCPKFHTFRADRLSRSLESHYTKTSH